MQWWAPQWAVLTEQALARHLDTYDRRIIVQHLMRDEERQRAIMAVHRMGGDVALAATLIEHETRHIAGRLRARFFPGQPK
jgi:hypothetical protein